MNSFCIWSLYAEVEASELPTSVCLCGRQLNAFRLVGTVMSSAGEDPVQKREDMGQLPLGNLTRARGDLGKSRWPCGNEYLLCTKVATEEDLWSILKRL